MSQLPQQIQAIREQLGTGINGATAYVGAHQLTYSCKCENGGAESKVTENGMVDAPVSFGFKVNGKKNCNWHIIVSLEPSDTYTVRLWASTRISTKKACELVAEGKVVQFGKILDSVSDVYCDKLQECVENMYDKAIKEHCGGFIPIG